MKIRQSKINKQPQINYEIERAIKFLVQQFEKCGDNSKPVILHSIRVGLNLYNQNYKKEIVIAGILHDLLEDTDTKYDQIKKEFGKKVAELVRVNSYDTKNLDKIKRCMKMYNACKKFGKDALIVKSADILDNMPYIIMAENKKTKQYCLTIWKYFIKIAKAKIGKEKVYRDLEREFEK